MGTGQNNDAGAANGPGAGVGKAGAVQGGSKRPAPQTRGQAGKKPDQKGKGKAADTPNNGATSSNGSAGSGQTPQQNQAPPPASTTPRQENKLLPNVAARSSPATHMALARSVLKNPTYHTLELAQKLVGQEAFMQMMSEMGGTAALPNFAMQGKAEGTSGPVASGSGTAGSTSNAEAGSSTQGSVAHATRAQTKTATASGVPNLGKGNAPVSGQRSAPGATNAAAGSSRSGSTQRPVCKNCGTIETPRWRVKTLADGKERRVCDACGIYFNKEKQMRPKEMWSPKSNRIPLEDIPHYQSGGQWPIPRKPSATPPAPSAPAQTTHHEVTFKDLPGSPPRQPRIVSDTVFTTPRRSTRLSQGTPGMSKAPLQEETLGSPKQPRRTPRRTAAAAAANKVKATFEGNSSGARVHKQLMDLSRGDETPTVTSRMLDDQFTRSPSRDRSVTPPPVSEAVSRHNQSSVWDGSDFPLEEDANFLQNIKTLAEGLSTDSEGFDLSAFLGPDQPQPQHDTPKFTQNELDLLIALSQQPGTLDQDDGSLANKEQATFNWDASSPWSVPTPSKSNQDSNQAWANSINAMTQ